MIIYPILILNTVLETKLVSECSLQTKNTNVPLLAFVKFIENYLYET